MIKKKFFEDEEKEEKKKNSFDPSEVKEIDKKEIVYNDKNKIVLRRIEYRGKKYLDVCKFYKVEGSVVWNRGKAIWLPEEAMKEMIKSLATLYKDKK